MNATVKLFGLDHVCHATLSLPVEQLRTAQVLRRNERFYILVAIPGGSRDFYYHEVVQPWDVSTLPTVA